MIIVSGASGGFGRAAAEMLLERVDPASLILTTRTPAKLADLAAKGAQVRLADFDRPETLAEAFAGGTRMLLISTARVGTRVGQHRAAAEAAVKAGVRHIVYTSLINADKAGNPAIVKLDHRATEEILEGCGAAWTFLRDSQYADAVAGAVVPGALAAGRLPDNAGNGAIAFVARKDCVASAVGVLTSGGHENVAYTLTGPEMSSFPKAIALASEIAGKPIEMVPVDDEGMFAHFDGIGIPRHASDDMEGIIPWCSEDMVTFGRAIREGYFAECTDHVERLTGRPATPLREVMLAHKDSWPK